jgi:uncharacterized membrane protein YeiB
VETEITEKQLQIINTLLVLMLIVLFIAWIGDILLYILTGFIISLLCKMQTGNNPFVPIIPHYN